MAEFEISSVAAARMCDISIDSESLKRDLAHTHTHILYIYTHAHIHTRRTYHMKIGTEIGVEVNWMRQETGDMQEVDR